MTVQSKTDKDKTKGRYYESNTRNEDEILSHLQVIQKQIKAKLKQINNEVTKTIQLEDSNCYGDHTVIINLDADYSYESHNKKHTIK